MKLEVIRNLQFSRLVKTENLLREFNFTRLRGLMEGYFSVDVADEKGNRIIFLMEQVNNHWQIARNEIAFPSWVLSSMDKLSEMIEKALDKYDPDFLNPVLPEAEDAVA